MLAAAPDSRSAYLLLSFLRRRSRHLISLRLQTFPSIRSFRLHDLLTKSTSLRSVSISIQETILSHQIQWTFGPKLKELVITGAKLQTILPDAFIGRSACNDRPVIACQANRLPTAGLSRSSGLVLRITGTAVTHLPPGLLRLLDNRLSVLDIRGNRLTSLSPDVLLPPTGKANRWHSFTSKSV